MSFWSALQLHKEKMDNFLNQLPSYQHPSAKAPFPGKEKKSSAITHHGQELLFSSSICRKKVHELGLTQGAGRSRQSLLSCRGSPSSDNQLQADSYYRTIDSLSPLLAEYQIIWKGHERHNCDCYRLLRSQVYSVTCPAASASGWIPAHSAPFSSCDKASLCWLL